MHSSNYVFNINDKCFINIPESGGNLFSKIVNDNKLDIVIDKNNRPISSLCTPKIFKYIIILRNPIQRVISYYNMVKKKGWKNPYFKYSNNYNSFLNNCWEVNNQLTLYLASVDCSKFTEKNIKISDKIYKVAFNVAKNNINKLNSIIFFKDYINSIKNFFKKENNLELEDLPNLTIPDNSKDISEEDYNLVKKHNKYDLMLYEYALRLNHDGKY